MPSVPLNSTVAKRICIRRRSILCSRSRLTGSCRPDFHSDIFFPDITHVPVNDRPVESAKKKKKKGEKKRGPRRRKSVTAGELIYLERIKKKREGVACETISLDASKICILYERVYITLINTRPIR